ncbi:MAG: TOMM precursor leader peptide-binding protein [Alphaproteobacteria bacterium]|nr:TOMM precursor leader peptide-binding protein [Alphaproteobacteria bacterium]
MIRVPALEPRWRAITIPGEGVLLFSEEGVHTLRGTLYERVMPLIDGRRQSEAIAAHLRGEIEPAKVYYALELLEKSGFVVESAPDLDPGRAVFWHGLGLDPRMAEDALRRARVGVSAIGEADADPLRGALAAMGIALATDTDTETDLDVVVTRDYLDEGLSAIDQAARSARRRWMLVRPFGHEVWIGPLFVPGRTGCLHCLRHKLSRHRLAWRFAVAHGGDASIPLAAMPASIRAAGELTVIEVAKILVGAETTLEGMVLSLDVRNWVSQTHQLIRNPTCPACGALPDGRAQPVVLRSGKVGFAEDWGHRTVPPAVTMARFRHLISPICGVVKSLRSCGGGGHVWTAGHNAAVRLEKLSDLKWGLRHGSCGKGMSEAQAQASALCECLERYCGEAHGSEIRVTGSFRAMRHRMGDAVIHPNKVMGFSDRQYATRAIEKGSTVPDPLDEDTAIDWTPVWSLTNSRHEYLPTQLLYFGAEASQGSDARFCVACSNGNAAGSTIEEAVLHGFLELVERDAAALWWYNRLTRPGVDLDDPGAAWSLDFVARHGASGRRVWALDITSDLGIPVFAALSARTRSRGAQGILIGLGCHLDARIALQRAFTELDQMWVTAEGGARSGMAKLSDPQVISWLRNATCDNQPHLAPAVAAGPSPCAADRSPPSGDLLLDIEACRRLVEARGMEMLVLDQTRADVGLPVVKVIVPGLRHFRARFAAGRLYDVPVAMGWRDGPLAEEELNPIPIFL